MRCEKARKRLSDVLDGVQVPRGRKLELERHLQACPACRDYQSGLLLLGKAAQALVDPGLPDAHWDDLSIRLEARLRAEAGPRTRSRARAIFSWKWAWAGVSFLALVLAGGYLAFLRPRAAQEPAFISVEDSLSRIVIEASATPGIESSFNQEILASLGEIAFPPGEDTPVFFGDNPLLWESLSEGELAFIEGELEKEQGFGGLS